MKTYLKFTGIAIILLSIFSCNKEDNHLQYLSDCIEVEEQVNWIKEPFNANYTIMYPDSYNRRSKYLLPHSKLELRREDEKVVIVGGLCDPTALPCHVWDYYGESIDTEIDSVVQNSTSNKYLNIKKTFCQDKIDIAYFYYNDSMGGNFRNAYGALFLIDTSDLTFRKAGYISFAKSEEEEILDILRTLHFE